jgi:hypothetical protein
MAIGGSNIEERQADPWFGPINPAAIEQLRSIAARQGVRRITAGRTTRLFGAARNSFPNRPTTRVGSGSKAFDAST